MSHRTADIAVSPLSRARRIRRILGHAAWLTAALLVVGVVQAPVASALPDQRIGYGFEEGTGTAVTDTSANGTAATATGATWTGSGRYGAGIVFNGTSTRVRSNTDVALPGAFTLEAWVFNPTAQAYETVVTVGENRDLYLANGTVRLWTGTADLAFGPALATNTWQHVALVSTGTAVSVYVDGVQRGTTQNATLGAVTAPVQVGAWIYGSSNVDYFSGTLDEVRVYTRALSPAEIATDRDAAIVTGGGGADTSPPALSGGSPTGTLAAGTTQSTLAVTTDEPATCRFGTTANTAYAALPNAFATTGGNAHSTVVTGLTNGTSYTVYVRCQDAAGNASAADYPITFAVASPAASGLGSWGTTSALPAPRSANGATYGNGYLYLVGGIDGTGNPVTTVEYAARNADGSLGAWATTTPLPVPIRSTRPVFAGGYVYLSGGGNNSGNLSTVYFAQANANGTLGAWQTTTPLPQAMLSHALVASGNYLYAVGGNPGSCITTVRVAPRNANGTIGAWSSTTALPAARCGIVESVTAYQGRLYAVAGYDNANITGTVLHAPLNADGTVGTWQTNATGLGTPREYSAIEAFAGRLYVIGGQAALFGDVTASVEQAAINADGSVGTFTAATSLPAPRGYLATEMVDGSLYVVGGGTAISGGTAQSTVWVAAAAGGTGGGGADTTPPARSGGSPTGSLAAGATQATLQVTTNEAATCRYGTTPGTAYAALPTAFATTGGTAHATTVTGLAPGTSTYVVRCSDAAGNANPDDYPITFTVPAAGGGDTTAPTVAVTAPAAAASVTGTTTVTATASDDVGVVGVQFLLDGAALGTEDTTAPYSVAWDSTTAANGTHTLTARARDAAGNQTVSAAVQVTVANAAGTGPAVAYGFGEGAGTAVANAGSAASGAATATSPTWTAAGQFGSAITFDGTASRVRSTGSLTVGGAFTVEAWVRNPTAQDYETIATLGQLDVYLNYGVLNLYTDSGNVAFGAALTADTWQHVAVVSTGTTVTAYVDGVQRGTTQNLAISGASGPLQVGAWIYGSANVDYFSGSLDEVRLYGRALSAAEIAADRTTPIGGTP